MFQIIEPSSKLPSSRVTVEICRVASGSNLLRFISKTLTNLLKSEGATSGVPQIGNLVSINLDITFYHFYLNQNVLLLIANLHQLLNRLLLF